MKVIGAWHLALRRLCASRVSSPIQRQLYLVPENCNDFNVGNLHKIYNDEVVKIFHKRCFNSGVALQDNVEIVVQSMGESISEGSIAEILKEAGSAVDMDETIAQIETDKVTIDVKTPVAGILNKLQVKVDDIVKVGDLIAIVEEGKAPKKNQPLSKGSKKPAESGTAGRSTNNNSEGSYKPMISFPKRMTDDGRRISDLMLEEQLKFKHTPTQGTSAVRKTVVKKDETPRNVTKLTQSHVLSQYEMDIIELGGAEPY